MTEAQLRPQAESDLVDRTRYYRTKGGDDVGRRFFDAAIAALRHIERLPGAGSSRVGEGFFCGWFYFVTPSHADVVRLLTNSQHMFAILGGTTPE